MSNKPPISETEKPRKSPPRMAFTPMKAGSRSTGKTHDTPSKSKTPNPAAKSDEDIQEAHSATCEPGSVVTSAARSKSEGQGVYITTTAPTIALASKIPAVSIHAEEEPRSANKMYTATLKRTQDLNNVELKKTLRASGKLVVGNKATQLAELAALNKILDQRERNWDGRVEYSPETPTKKPMSTTLIDGLGSHDPSILMGMRVRVQKGKETCYTANEGWSKKSWHTICVNESEPRRFDLVDHQGKMIVMYYPMIRPRHAELKLDDKVLGMLNSREAYEKKAGLLLRETHAHPQYDTLEDYRIVEVDVSSNAPTFDNHSECGDSNSI